MLLLLALMCACSTCTPMQCCPVLSSLAAAACMWLRTRAILRVVLLSAQCCQSSLGFVMCCRWSSPLLGACTAGAVQTAHSHQPPLLIRGRRTETPCGNQSLGFRGALWQACVCALILALLSFSVWQWQCEWRGVSGVGATPQIAVRTSRCVCVLCVFTPPHSTGASLQALRVGASLVQLDTVWFLTHLVRFYGIYGPSGSLTWLRWHGVFNGSRLRNFAVPCVCRKARCCANPAAFQGG